MPVNLSVQINRLQWRSEGGGKGRHHAPGAVHKGAPNSPQNYLNIHMKVWRRAPGASEARYATGANILYI